jgi:hypothetical protein
MVKFRAANEMCVISGGNWNNGSNAGVFARNLNNTRNNANNNVGLRCDCAPSSDSLSRHWSTGIGRPGLMAKLYRPANSGSNRERLGGVLS